MTRRIVEARVPVGFDMHDEKRIRKAGVKRLYDRFESLLDQVMANQEDLVDVVHTLKQVVCVKG